MDNLGYLYFHQEEYDKAESLYQSSYACRRDAHGIEHPDTDDSANRIVMIYQKKGEFEQVQEFLATHRSSNL